MSLRTGTELITLTIIVNKISGIYGIIALLTGLHLSPLQLSMYIYSLIVLALFTLLAPHIRKQSLLQCIALAWLCLIDSVINAMYTAAFGLAWFIVLAKHATNAADAPGGSTIDEHSGFTDPKYNVSHVDVVATEASGLTSGQDAVTVGKQANGGGDAAPIGSLSEALFQSGSIASICIISALWAIRIYFVLVVLSYARGLLRQHILLSSQQSPYGLQNGSQDSKTAENPFAEGREEGKGWKGRLERIMVGVGKSYWLGSDEEHEAWVRGVGSKFGRENRGTHLQPPGVSERERRRRSGTGPPAPPTLRLHELQP